MKNYKAGAFAVAVSIRQDWLKYLSDRRFVEIEDKYPTFTDGSITAVDLECSVAVIRASWKNPTVAADMAFLEKMRENDSTILKALEPSLSKEAAFIQATKILEWFDAILELYAEGCKVH